MAEALEAAMLVCFGFSWPMNLIKNIKAKTAKSMSLKFILLIIAGYVAGIIAKVINHRFNYVLVVYLINLCIVSLNIIVYFINKKHDKVGAAKCVEKVAIKQEAIAMGERKVKLDIIEKYSKMNALANDGGVVLFGSNYFDSLPFAELAQMLNLNESLYNRSISNKNIDFACDSVDVCVSQLNPSKVFVNLGDYDLIDASLSVDEFIEKYQWILYSISTTTKADIYVVSVFSDSEIANKVNARLKALANDHGCKYVDITSAIGADNQDIKMFDMIKVFARTHKITFDEAMNTVVV